MNSKSCTLQAEQTQSQGLSAIWSVCKPRSTTVVQEGLAKRTVEKVAVSISNSSGSCLELHIVQVQVRSWKEARDCRA